MDFDPHIGDCASSGVVDRAGELLRALVVAQREVHAAARLHRRLIHIVACAALTGLRGAVAGACQQDEQQRCKV